LSADLLVPGTSFESIIRAGVERGQYVEAIGRVDTWVEQRLFAHRSGNATLLQILPDGRTVRIVERRMPDGHTVGFRFDITDLILATEAAQAASQSKSNFLATMSHEIRTPMNAIMGMLSLLQGTELTARQRDYVDKTDGAAKSLLGLLNDILDFSKAEANKLTLESLPFRLDAMLRTLSVVLSANAAGKNIEVLFDIDAELPTTLLGDSMRLQQVLINLGGNAVKFTSQGQVVLVLRQVHQDAQNVRIEFQVQDSGIGIAAEHQDMIFSGFSQAEASTTRRFGGTGLGLAICKRLVSLMGGEILLTSTLGAGSTFSFTLEFPLAQQVAALGESRESTTLKPCPVLVVDDNAVAGELTLKLVHSWGWSAELVRSGAEALEKVNRDCRIETNQFPFPVIFMDWQMPDMDGWETTRRLKELAAHLNMPAPTVIMVTAQGREAISHRSEAEQDMLSGFLVKPVTASMLLDAVMDASRGTAGVRRTSTQRSSKRRLAGMRVLLVEDNLINQQVADELLSAEGAIVSLAANGKLGVEAVAVAAPQFDIVLMDIQMPVMDGYEATRQIREELGLRDLAIVAMTANAMSSDREVCLAAGMNEHIGKPFDMAKLVSIMLRMTGLQISSDSTQVTLPAEPPSGPLPQIAGLDLSTALARMGGMQPLYVRTAKDFRRLLETTLAELRHELDGNDLKAVAMRLHTLKGNAGTLGAVDLARLAAHLEKLCKIEGWQAACAAELGGLSKRVEDTSRLLEQAILGLESISNMQSKPVNEESLHGEALLGVLREISGMAAAADLAVLQRFSEVRDRFENTPNGFLEQIEEALQDLDLDAVHLLCEGQIMKLP
jgi:signal transduction histidine kinase/DNA-binding response OmpR family regulator/HPt (histidine-containing phosphotransfer) domain-containing protein